MLVEGGYVYWDESTTFSIRGVSISGGNPNVLAVGQSYPDSLAANASAVYWANSGDGAVRMVAK